jgi:Family of unknown function (DUF5677)
MPDTARQVAERLLALYDDPGPSIEFATPYRAVGALAHGLYTAARRTARAILLLADAGYSAEAAPLRRCLAEHAVGLRRLAATDTAAATAVLHAYRKWVGRLQRSMAAAGWDGPDEAFAVILAGASPKAADVKLRELFTKWGSDDTYTAWLYETNSSHLSFTTAHRYVVGDRLENAELADHAVGHRFDDDRFVAAQLLIATEAFHRLLVDKPWATELAAAEPALHGGGGP